MSVCLRTFTVNGIWPAYVCLCCAHSISSTVVVFEWRTCKVVACSFNISEGRLRQVTWHHRSLTTEYKHTYAHMHTECVWVCVCIVFVYKPLPQRAGCKYKLFIQRREAATRNERRQRLYYKITLFLYSHSHYHNQIRTHTDIKKCTHIHKSETIQRWIYAVYNNCNDCRNSINDKIQISEFNFVMRVNYFI